LNIGARVTLIGVMPNVAAVDLLVVGLDGSSSDAATLAWAQREAAARGSALRVLESDGGSRNAFLDEATDAALLIVGPEPAAGGTRRGSCPVVVVRGASAPEVRRIVVGVDSSNAAAAALDWAAHAAVHHNAALTVVHAWQSPASDEGSLRLQVLRHADARCIADLAADLFEPGPDHTIRRCVAEGPAADVLLAASTRADLLVVGSRGRSGFRTMEFGSVAHAAVMGSHCPVAIVHPRLRTSGTGDPNDSSSHGGS
jgi:nucleotide-binding universal stress UspA family protein